MNLMVVTDKNYLKHTYIMLYSFFCHHTDRDIDVYLPYEGLSEEDLQSLQKYVASFGNGKLIPLYVGDAFKQKVVSQSNISVETYYRILAIDLLPEDVDRILYMDVDLCIKAPLYDLYDIQMGEALFAVCDDIIAKLNGFYDENKMRLGIPDEYSYFNAGVMLFHISKLRQIDAAQEMLDKIFANYERYLYNDQDVMNELYYDRLLYVGWDTYNCPPAWYFLDTYAAQNGKLVFADYATIKDFSSHPKRMEQYVNITSQIYENAKVVHYLGDLKPWSSTREDAKLFEIFDQSYINNKKLTKIYLDKLKD